MFSSLDNVNGTKLFIIFIAMIVIWLIYSYISMRILYKPLYTWWAQNGGKKYDDKLSISTLAAANYSTFLYYIGKLFRGPLNQLTIDQVRFIIGQLFPYMTYVQNGTQYGIITPKSLCETVLLSKGDGDAMFDLWFDNFTRQGTILKEGAPLKYSKSDPIKKDGVPGGVYYNYIFTPNTGDGDEKNYSGVYPIGASDTNNWTGLVLEWLNGGDDSDSAMWGICYDDVRLFHPYVVNEPADKQVYVNWFTNKGVGRADNFLARMGIMPDAPLLIYFLNNQFSSQGMEVDPQAFQNLVAPAGASVAGGWIGYLNGSSSKDYDYFVNTIRTTTDFPMPPPPPQCTKPDVGKGVLAGALSAISIGIMAAMDPPAAPFIIGGAVVAGGISGYQAGKGTC